MARLTKTQKAQLNQALHHAKRAQAFIKRPDIHVCRETKTTVEPHNTFRNVDGTTVASINKDMGSDLTGIEAAMDAITAFMEQHGPK